MHDNTNKVLFDWVSISSKKYCSKDFIDLLGLVYALKAGTTQIYAETLDGSQSASCTVTVEPVLVEDITVNSGNVNVANLRPGDRFQLTATVIPANATNKTVYWGSSNTEVATVNLTTGEVLVRSFGTTTIYAYATDGSSTFRDYRLVLTNPVTGIYLSDTSLNLIKGQSKQLEATVVPSDATDTSVVWSSDDPNVATVSNGVVTGVGGGFATISAHAADGSNVVATCEVSVYEVSVSPNTFSIGIGSSIGYSLSITPAPPGTTTIQWKTNDTDKITLSSNGTVTALKEGTATVEAYIANLDESIFLTISCVDPREPVEIKKDDHSFYVEFVDGKMWKFIGLDLSKRSEHYTQIDPPQFTEEFYNSLIAEEQRYLDNRSYIFSEHELGFLYLLDPLGIEFFIRTDACVNMSTIEKLFFKDRVYENIFGVKPRLFRKLNSGDLQYYEYPDYDIDYRYSVHSYAEMMFGEHLIVDVLSIAQALSTLVEEIFVSLPHVSTFISTVDLCRAMFFSGSIVGILDGGPSSLIDAYTEVDEVNHCGTMLSWCSKTIDVISTIVDIASGFLPPNVNDSLIYQKINEENYVTKFVVNGNTVTIKDIIDHTIVP